MINTREPTGDKGATRPADISAIEPPHIAANAYLHDLLLDVGFRAERCDNLQAAEEIYAKAVAAEPDSALAWYNYGDVILALGRAKEALKPLRKAVQLSPGNALYHYDLGLALYSLNRFAAASREFRLITAIDPQLKRASSTLGLSAVTNLALSLERQGKVDVAITTFTPAVTISAEILFNHGRLLMLAKRPAEALPFAQAAASLQTEREDAVHTCGRVLMDLHREREALDFLRRATRLNPKCASAWYDLGVVLARLRKRTLARPCFRKAIQVDPGYAWAYYDLACLDALAGHPDDAFARLEDAVARGLDDLAHLREDTDLRSLRHDPRWRAIQKRIRLNRTSPGK